MKRRRELAQWMPCASFFARSALMRDLPLGVLKQSQRAGQATNYGIAYIRCMVRN